MKKYPFAVLVFCGALVLIALVSLVIRQLVSAPGISAELSYGEEQNMHIPLNKDATYDVESNGYIIHIQVKDGKAAFVDSPCPDHLCEQFGWLQETGDIAVCLPATAMLMIPTESS